VCQGSQFATVACGRDCRNVPHTSRGPAQHCCSSRGQLKCFNPVEEAKLRELHAPNALSDFTTSTPHNTHARARTRARSRTPCRCESSCAVFLQESDVQASGCLLDVMLRATSTLLRREGTRGATTARVSEGCVRASLPLKPLSLCHGDPAPRGKCRPPPTTATTTAMKTATTTTTTTITTTNYLRPDPINSLTSSLLTDPLLHSCTCPL
jgi:hypothetical protein